ncbi:hypothetical protein, partial [Stenotrophomonas indicatrix]|uniref:hypothetical protein n=1 Tax=Stenotrophomonas indicatrix TaxID=2045451 RepID=UPI0028A8F9D5
REPVLRTGTLRFSVNQGTAPNSLRSDIGASSPLIPLRCSARYKADPTSKAAAAPSRSTPCVDAFAVDRDLPFRLERAEHRRSGEGEEARVPERSEFPRPPSTDRGAQGTGAQHRLADGGAFLLVTFLFARKEK